MIEVAKRCGVSQSTVSRVLNNSTAGRFSVSPVVRERILDAARELSYRPSVAARNLSAGKTHLVAVLGICGIWPDQIGPSEEAVSSLAVVLHKAGYDLSLQFLARAGSAHDVPPLRVNGVVAVGASNADDLRPLEAAGIPYVAVNGLAGERGSLVAPDDAQGAALALRHLVDLGHRRIAYLDHWTVGATHPSVRERRAAYARASAALGFEAPDLALPMMPANSPWDSFYEPFVRRAILDCKATAVLAYSHHGALGVMRTAHDLGLSVPRDFSLICFNDQPAVRLAIPSITVVDIPSARMGQVAATLLLQQMTAPAEGNGNGNGNGNLADVRAVQPQHVRLPESLIVRESSAPPGGRRGS